MNGKKIYIATAALLLLFSACEMTGSEPEYVPGPEGKAAVLVRVNAVGISGRTALPSVSLTAVNGWKLLGGTQAAVQTLLADFSDPDSQTFYLEPGTWDFTLEGYKDSRLVLRGNLDNRAIVYEGPNVLSFTVAPVSEGSGSLKLTIQLPPEHGISTVKVFRDGAELETALTPDGDTIIYEDSPAAGDYYYSLRLYTTDNLLYGVVTELVQVRMNLNSEKTYTLGREDLNLAYIINYHTEGGQFEEAAPGSYRSTDKDLLLAVPVRAGYTFAGWYDNEDFSGNPVTAIPQGSMEDKTFYAKWTGIAYTVEYNANGGSGTTTSSTHSYGTPQNLSVNGFTKTGYTFAGWNTQADGDASYSDGQSVSDLSSIQGATVNLYAQWTVTTYTISYELYGGINAAENLTAYTVETPTITLTVPTRAGYSFHGWYNEAEFTNAVTQIAQGSTGDRTFHALWWSDVSAAINLWVNEDGSITGAQDVSISKTGSPRSFTVTVADAYTVFQWQINGITLGGSARTLTIPAADYPAGTYILALRVIKGAVPYSTDIQFTVTN
jgi:uncharacterized repeat protein (TIGR02543 family)